MWHIHIECIHTKTKLSIKWQNIFLYTEYLPHIYLFVKIALKAFSVKLFKPQRGNYESLPPMYSYICTTPLDPKTLAIYDFVRGTTYMLGPYWALR